MLSEVENAELTAVGPGSAMGEYLRRYWHPVAASGQLDGGTVKPVRLLGEDLVLFRNREGRCGLLARHCPHRRADLAYGYVDEEGLRCSYHGWCFEPSGNCVARPYEDAVSESSRSRDSAKAPAYQVLEHAGLVWAYLGPAPAPELPNWEPFSYTNGFAQIVFSEIPCNWLQCQENSIDPVHFEWLHTNWSRVQRGDRGYGPTHRKIQFEDLGYGIGYHRLLETEDESSINWRIMRLCLFPNVFLPRSHFEYRVPVDESTTLSVVWHFTPVPEEAAPYQQKTVPYWTAPVFNDDGSYITTHVLNQDFAAWIGQGRIADRSRELVGRSDRGVVMLRRALQEGMRAVAEGRDPAGITGRSGEPHVGEFIPLPGDRKSVVAPRLDRERWLDFFWSQGQRSQGKGDLFWLLAGQPDHVRQEFADAVGFSVEELAG